MQEKFMIRVLEEISATGSISGAAKKLFVTQPHVSKTLSQYEKNLGVSLVDRGGKPLFLTYAGQQYLHQLKKIEVAYEHLEHKMSSLSDFNKGTFNIGACPSLYNIILEYIVPAFIKTYPGMKINAKSVEEEKAGMMLQHNSLDYYIGMPIYNKDLSFVNMTTTGTVLIVPQTSTLYDENLHETIDFPLSTKELNGQNFIGLPNINKYQRTINNFLVHNDLSLNYVAEVGDTKLATALALAGSGCTFVQENLANSYTFLNNNGNYNLYFMPQKSLWIPMGSTYLEDSTYSELFLLLDGITADVFKMLDL